MTLLEQTRALAKQFRNVASAIDEAYAKYDPRAVQGGARDPDAAMHENFYRRLRDLATEMENEGVI